MGEIKVKVRLRNEVDVGLAEAGKLAKTKIRSVEIDAVVDTGAVMVLLPQELVERLGLRRMGKAIVRLANEQKIELEKAGGLSLTIGEREMSTTCLIGPPGYKPLIGQIVLEELDFITDPIQGTLTPRPESSFLPTVKMK